MKISKLILAAIAVMTIAACKKDKIVEPTDHGEMLNYEVMIMKPDTSMKMIDSNMHMHIRFSEKDNKTVHHINVKIYQKDDPTNVIYDMPTAAHVHATTGLHEHHDDLILSAANGVIPHKMYVLEAKVWGHEAGKHEVIESTQFHIHKM